MTRSSQDRRVVALYWKKLTATDAGALLDLTPPSGTGQGAKHLPVWARLDMVAFLGNPPRTAGTTEKPSYTVSIEGHDGAADPVEIRFDIRGQNRREWLICRQHREEQHPEWRPGDKLPANEAAIPGNYILLLRLSDGSIHARAATPDEVAQMPERVRSAVVSADQGILEL